MKENLKEILKFVGVFALLIVIYFILLTAVSIFPSKIIKENIKESADYLINKPESEKIELGFKDVYIFQFTNALMLNTAYSIDSEHPIESFLVARKNYIPGVTKIIYEKTPKDLQSAAKYYTEKSKPTDAYQIAELYDTAYENNLYESFEYARYWHGYLAYLRPLLIIFNYEQIEIISTLVLLVLLLAVSIIIWKKINPLIAISLVLCFFASDIHIISVSINEVTCFTLSLIFTLYILIKFDQIKNLGMLFFIMGSITNFIDFLTNPIVVYSLPIITYFLLLQKKQEVSKKETIKIYFKTSVLWILGYGLTWATKWIITDLILNKGIIQNALEQVQFRTTGNKKYTLYHFFIHIMVFVSEKTAIVIFVSSLILMIAQLIISNFDNIKNMFKKEKQKEIKNEKKSLKKYFSKKDFERILPYFIGMCAPFVWYLVAFNHSIVHRFFTYRNVLIVFFGFQTMLIIFATKKIEDSKETKNN